MAARRNPAPEPEQTEVVPYDTGLDASDLTLPRLRVVGKDADLVNAGVAKPADVAIGNSSDDEDSTVYEAPGGVTFHVLSIRSNYACGFNGPKGQWEAGDPEMPAEAKKQYHVMLCVPEFNTILPVMYTANGMSAKEFRNVNTVIAQAAAMGKAPYESAFTISTKTYSATIGGAQKLWPGPVFRRAEATEANLEVARAMHESFQGSRKQIAAASSDDDGSATPSF
jgi:hypothetical protein